MAQAGTQSATTIVAFLIAVGITLFAAYNMIGERSTASRRRRRRR